VGEASGLAGALVEIEIGSRIRAIGDYFDFDTEQDGSWA
jgi:hypothetical protein